MKENRKEKKIWTNKINISSCHLRTCNVQRIIHKNDFLQAAALKGKNYLFYSLTIK
jgi:hypothetical protein